MNIENLISEAAVLVDGTPEDVNRALKLIRDILREDSSNESAFELLTRVINNVPSFSDAAQEILQIYKPSTKTMDEPLQQADDAYYSGEYAKAIAIYEQALKQEPSNARAKEQIEKARILQLADETNAKLPRESIQLYRRARSYINAQDMLRASELLEKAIAIAEEKNVSFPQAEKLLDSMGQVVVANEFKQKARSAIRDHKLGIALEFVQQAQELDTNDKSLNMLLRQIRMILDIEKDISQSENNDCADLRYTEKLDVLRAEINHPWLIDAEIVQRVQTELYDLRRAKSHYFGKQGITQLDHAKEALYLSVMSELSGKAIENFEKALICDPQDPDIPSLISEAKAIKDKVDSIINGDEKSFLDFLQRKNERQKTIIEITRRMETVISEFDKGSEEYKSLWQQLEGLFDKRTKSLTASDDHISVVLAKVDAEIKNIRDRRPWGTTLVIAVLIIIVSGVLLALNPKRNLVHLSAEFPADLILYASLFGSAVRIVVDLFDRSRTKWVDTIRLSILRPLIGMGVTLLIVLFVYSGFGTIFAFSPTMGFWGYVSLSSIIGYSDSIMNKIIKILEKGISIRV